MSYSLTTSRHNVRGFTPSVSSYSSRYGGSSYGSGFGSTNFNRYRSRFSSDYDSYRRPSYNFGDAKPKYGSWRDDISRIDDDKEDDDDDMPPTPPPAPEQDDDIMADLHIDDNKAAHHTDRYGVPGLVLRRGQEFKFTVTLGRGQTPDNTKVMLQFATGEEPKVTRNTRVRLNLSTDNLTPEVWGVKVEKKYSKNNAHCLDLSIMAPADAVVGQYTFWVDIFPKTGEGCKSRYRITDDLYLIFNAWCKDDQVYMASASDREEYVMNETGRIYVGQASSIHGRPWNFGQFAKSSLNASLYLLETCYLQKEAHGNPTAVSRALSAMANSNDEDGGVLTGNWSGDYRGGTSPTAWNGSVAILDEFMQRKRPVKYGQCWVFSGLLTTLMRALGIPTRSTTNFESAHDHDVSMTIDNHMGVNGRPKSELDDSVWNFHVWNESWFARPDLPRDSKGEGYDGWQAYDATPQEQSEGQMRCGPAPLRAIKEGHVYLGYDTKFIFAEVNGDRVTWLVDGAGDMMPTTVDLKSVGRFISAKKAGGNIRDDLTDQYKHPEGSDAEREAVRRACSHSSRKADLAHVYDLNKNKEVQFDFSGTVETNGDIAFVLHIKNTASESRSIKIQRTTAAKYYTGAPGEELHHKTHDVTLEAGEEKDLTWSAMAHEYMNRVPADANVCIYIMGKVAKTGQIFTSQKSFSVDKPDLDVTTSKNRIKKGEEFEVTIKLTNPFQINLTGGAIRLEGPGIQKDKEILLRAFIKPGQSFTEKVTLTPKYVGHREIIACFNSRQLTGITGSVEVDVV